MVGSDLDFDWIRWKFLLAEFLFDTFYITDMIGCLIGFGIVIL